MITVLQHLRVKTFTSKLATLKLASIRVLDIKWSNMAALCALSLGLATNLTPANAATVALDKVVAVVDSDVVMASELNQRMRMIVAQLSAQQTQMPPEDVIRKQVLEQLIVESLQLQMAERAGIQISESDLDNAINNMMSANKLSREQLQAKLAADGLSLSQLREQIRRDMLIERVQKGNINRRIQITEQEARNFLNSKQGEVWAAPSYNLGHILLPVASTANPEEVAKAQQQAEAMRLKLQNGADFREMAIKASKGQNALQGGDMGWRKGSELPALFVDALEPLQSGDVSEPLRSPAGFHILKVYERKGPTDAIIEQSLVRHILLKTSAIVNDQEARSKLASIRQQILNGADFGDMAKQYSDDVGSKLSGGDLGWSLPGKFVPAFEEAINSTDVGEITQPFQSQFGWHILQVQDRRQQDMSDTVRLNQAANLLRSQRFEEERFNWLREIRDEAFVEIKQ